MKNHKKRTQAKVESKNSSTTQNQPEIKETVEIKAEESPKQITEKRNIIKAVRIFAISFGFFALIAVIVFLIFQGLSKKEAASVKANDTICIKNEEQAKLRVKEIPEVQKYFKSVKDAGINKTFITIDNFMVSGNETKTGYAFVGEESENGSKYIFAKYLFLSGCNVKFQKVKQELSDKFGPVQFSYTYKVAEKTYTDATKACYTQLSGVRKIDFDKDGQPEYLYSCFKGENDSAITYYLHDINEGNVTLLDTVTSSGVYEEVADYNNDSYLDLATSGILMDEGNCKGDECLVGKKTDGSGSHMLLRSYHHFWNQKNMQFDAPVKAGVYYNQNGKRIAVPEK